MGQLLDKDKLLAGLIFSGFVDKATCEELKNLVDKCEADDKSIINAYMDAIKRDSPEIPESITIICDDRINPSIHEIPCGVKSSEQLYKKFEWITMLDKGAWGCPVCGTISDSRHNYCSHCGTRLNGIDDSIGG